MLTGLETIDYYALYCEALLAGNREVADDILLYLSNIPSY